MLGNDRGMAVEYLILSVLVALGSLFLVYRYGHTVRGRVDQAEQRVDRVGANDGQRAASSGAVATNDPALHEAVAPPSQGQAGGGSGAVDVLGFQLSISMACAH